MKNDGGPAFPRPFSEDKFNEDMLPSQTGMSLRDWFAGKSLQGLRSNPDFAAVLSEKVSEWAYLDADAMLDERSKRDE